MKIAAEGPPACTGGVVQFDNWTWPGIALGGQQACEVASFLLDLAKASDARAEELEGQEQTPENLLLRANFASDARRARKYADLLRSCWVRDP